MTTELLSFRSEITNLDNEILKLLEERMDISREIGEYKKENGLEVQDTSREETLVNERKMNTSLNGDFIEKLFTEIMKESRRVQEDDA